jgi:hypothetical protein
MRVSEASLRLVVVAIVLGWTWCSAGARAADKSAALLTALESIRVDQLKGYVDHLADDALEGREAGSPGGRKAGDYLAAQLHRLGLSAAGVDGGYFQPFGPGFRNVLVRLEGSDPRFKHEHVVVGAHYDHIGYGKKGGSLGPAGQIHNGADDNASGTSALLELAEAFTMLPEPPKRSILFAFWDAEEKRMLGSKHWADQPTLPLQRVVAVLNLDMVGRLRNDRLEVFGSRLGYGWRRLVSQDNEGPLLMLEFPWTTQANGDHWPFLDRGIPAVMFNTGLHDDYHRPSDDAHLINVQGMRRVTRFALAVAYDLANRDQVPAFRQAGRREKDSTRPKVADQQGDGAERLGAAWHEQQPLGGAMRLTRVVVGSPAHQAGLQPGDRIVALAGRPIRNAEELTWAVTAAASTPVSIVVERPGHDGPLELTAQLAGTPMRVGIRWRVDDAEPGAVILTEVVPGSPAARAGLQPGDHVYQIAGRDFSDEAEFRRLARTLPGPLMLLVERDGQIRTVEIGLESQPLERAA